MDKIKEILNKFKNMVKRIMTGNIKGRLPEGNFSNFRNSKISNNWVNNQIYGGIVSPENSYLEINGLRLPFGSFEINDNGNIKIKEELQYTPDGRILMRGENIASEGLQQELARQMRQNGRLPSGVILNREGEVVETVYRDEEETKKSASENYRSEMYDPEARRKTEEVSKKYRDELQEEKEDTRQQDDEEKEDTRQRDDEEENIRQWTDENGVFHSEINHKTFRGNEVAISTHFYNTTFENEENER